jgi:hypothetical protein
MEVYLHAFSTTTLNGSEFALCVGGFTQENVPSARVVQEVGWGPFVAILNVSCGYEERIWKQETGKERAG